MQLSTARQYASQFQAGEREARLLLYRLETMQEYSIKVMLEVLEDISLKGGRIAYKLGFVICLSGALQEKINQKYREE